MDALFKKLNIKNQKSIFVINAPESFLNDLKTFETESTIHFTTNSNDQIEFVLIFVQKQAEIDQYITQIAPLLYGDAICWMCYPKGSSKKYQCDFNRDTGWDVLGNYNLEPVRQVAIDEDWSALRFRKIEYIKNFTRKFDALSEKGKSKQSKA